jgi:uncharacterized protein
MYPKGNLFIPASHGRLEAILKEPAGEIKGAALACHPHPQGGGTMHNKVVFRVAAGLVEAGLATVRFNFRGVGASTGEYDRGDGEQQDVRDALDYLGANYPGHEITQAGFSFGSWVGSRAAINDDRVVRLVHVGTPVSKYGNFDYLEDLRKPILFVHGDRDEFGDVDTLKALTDKVSKVTETTVVIFENCGHFFENHLDELRDTIRDWVLEQS